MLTVGARSSLPRPVPNNSTLGQTETSRQYRLEDGRGPVLFEGPVPSAKAGEIVVRVDTAPLSHNDVRAIRRSQARLPLEVIAFGTCVAGYVSAVGPGGSSFHLDQRVIVPDCAAMSQDTACGSSFSEYVAVPVASAVALDDDITFEEAALIGIAARTWRDLKAAGLAADKNVAVLGASAASLASIPVLHAAGAARVDVYDWRRNRLLLASMLGADATHHIDRDGPPDTLSTVDFALTGEPTPRLAYLLAKLSMGTRVVSPDEMDREIQNLCEELSLSVVPADTTEPLDLYFTFAADATAARSEALRRLHTHSFTLGELPEAVDYLAGERDGMVMAVIKPIFDRRPPWGGWS